MIIYDRYNGDINPNPGGYKKHGCESYTYDFQVTNRKQGGLVVRPPSPPGHTLISCLGVIKAL
jgi:hypothetical protein